MTDKIIPQNGGAIMDKLAATIRTLRGNESVRDFADKIGVGHSDIFRLENGKTKSPSVFMIKKIADHFHMTVDELMGLSLKKCPTCAGAGWVKDGKK